MRKRHNDFIALAVMLAMLLAACASCNKKQAQEKKAPQPKIGVDRKMVEAEPFEATFDDFDTYQEASEHSPNYYLSSRTCRKCHDEIFEYWKNSMHSQSLTDPIFEAALYKAYRLIGEGSVNYCLKCHAPMASKKAGYNLASEVAREGVSCDFCHSIKDVNLNSDEKFVMSVGDTKYGPYKGTTSPFHKTEYSPVHTKSDLCGGCHNLINENGVEVMGTYNEWKNSEFAKNGVQCQDCHMPLVEGSRTVAEHVKEAGRRANSHLLEGGHSEKQLKKAIKVEITEIERKLDGINVFVEIANKGAGHKIPTGTPSRRLELNVIVYSDKTNEEITRATKVYRKALVGKSNQELRDDAELIMFASEVESDNRLAPGETRNESFRFPISPDTKIHVEAELVYCYDPVVFITQNMRVRMGVDSKSGR